MWQQPNLTSLPSRSTCDNSVLFDFLLDLLRNDETEAVPEVDDDVSVCRDNPVTEESSVAISGDRDDDDDDGIVSS